MPDDDRLADELASLRIHRDSPAERAGSSSARTGRRSGVPGWIVGIVVALLLGVGGLFVFREGKGRLLSQEVELGAVTLMSPAQGEVTLVATGYVQTRKKATVAGKTTGRIARLLVDEGDLVKEGQVIAELESADAQAALAQVRADIAAARAKVERARADVEDAQVKLAREDELLKKAAGTQMAYDDAKAHLATLRAQLSSADADVRAVEARQSATSVQLENTKVRAPFSGTVVRKLSEIGEVGGTFTGPPGVVMLADLNDLQVEADVSESQYGKVKVGTPAEILLDAFPDRRFRGQVADIRQTVDRAKASVTVKVKFIDPSKGVLPDMAAKVSFLAHALDDAALKAAPKLVAPADAIVTRNGRALVFTIEDDRVHENPVTVGATTGAIVELTAGPSPGAKIIRHPDEQLKEGSAVKEKKK